MRWGMLYVYFCLRSTSSTSRCGIPAGARRRSSLYPVSLFLSGGKRDSLQLGLVVALARRLGGLAPHAALDVQVRAGLCVAAGHDRGGVDRLRRVEREEVRLRASVSSFRGLSQSWIALTLWPRGASR